MGIETNVAGVVRGWNQVSRDSSRNVKENVKPMTHFTVNYAAIEENFGTVPQYLAVWCSGNALVSINAVALHRARLVLGWVTAFGQVNSLFGKTCATTQKNVKSHVFLDFEKNVKKRKKTYI